MFNVESLELHWSLDSQSIDQTSSSLSSSTNIRMMIVWFVLLVQGVAMFNFITRKWINSCFGPGCKDPVFRWHSLPWCKYRLNHLTEISGCMSRAWMLCEDFFHWMNKIRMLILNENTVCVPGCFSQGLLASCWCWQLRPESGKKPGFNPLLAEVCRKQKLQSENWWINEELKIFSITLYISKCLCFLISQILLWVIPLLWDRAVSAFRSDLSDWGFWGEWLWARKKHFHISDARNLK